MTSEMLSWDPDASKEMLNAAMRELQSVSAKFRLPMRFVEKDAAVGALFTGDENDTSLQNYLDEVALEVRERLNVLNYPVPFNCFNGGLDVFVDIGSKQHGLMALQALLNVNAEHTLHVGDQFSMAGNDLLARRVSPTCWVKGPKETNTHLKWLNRFYERKIKRSNSNI